MMAPDPSGKRVFVARALQLQLVVDVDVATPCGFGARLQGCQRTRQAAHARPLFWYKAT